MLHDRVFMLFVVYCCAIILHTHILQSYDSIIRSEYLPMHICKQHRNLKRQKQNRESTKGYSR